MRIKNFCPNRLKSLRLGLRGLKSVVLSLFLILGMLAASCNSELQEQVAPVENAVVRQVEGKFEKWYEAENKVIQTPKSNARLKFDTSVQLTYRYKEVDWTKYKKLSIPSRLAIYEFDFLAPNVVVPFDFKEKFGYQEALKRSKQTLLIFAEGDQVVKAYVVRYYFSGEKEWIDDFQKINYDAINRNWKGQIDLYALDETHLVSFDMVIGQVIGSETMELGSQDGAHQSQSANLTCTTTWTPGPCEPMSGGVGITCYDTFSTYCYNTSPLLMTGFPVWNGSSGSGSTGTVKPNDQSLCELDPYCIPHPLQTNSKEIFVLEEFEISFRKEMSESELQLFDKLNRTLQLNYLSNAYDAINLSNSLFEGNQYNGCGDAFRHAYFSGLNVSSLGYSLAKQLGDAHEEKPGNPALEKEMDLYNNEVGRVRAYSILTNGTSWNYNQILWQSLVLFGYDGGFKIITNGQLVNSPC